MSSSSAFSEKQTVLSMWVIWLNGSGRDCRPQDSAYNVFQSCVKGKQSDVYGHKVRKFTISLMGAGELQSQTLVIRTWLGPQKVSMLSADAVNRSSTVHVTAYAILHVHAQTVARKANGVVALYALPLAREKPKGGRK